MPASLATVLTGFLLLTTRRKAITQVVGYLVLENGIFLFGLLLLEAMPFLVEVGVLLDLFVGVFVMGIIIHHINREFASIGTRAPVGAEGIMRWRYALILASARDGALAAFAVPSDRLRPWLAAARRRWLTWRSSCLASARREAASARSAAGCVLDPLGQARPRLPEPCLFFLCSLYAPGYLRLRPRAAEPRLLRVPAARSWR